MDENLIAEDGSSTTKKLCTKAIKLEKITQEEAKTTKEEAKANYSGWSDQRLSVTLVFYFI